MSRATDVRLFDEQPDAGIKRWFVYDHDNDTFKIVTEQDTTGLLERSQTNYNRLRERSPWKGDFHHVGVIPMTVLEQAMREGWTEEDYKKWVNDPDNRKFRSRPGRV